MDQEQSTEKPFNLQLYNALSSSTLSAHNTENPMKQGTEIIELINSTRHDHTIPIKNTKLTGRAPP